MNGSAQSACRKNCWLAGVAGGVLVAAMLLFVAGHGFLPSLLAGAVVTVLLGIFFVWAFCTADTPAGADRPAAAPLAGPPVAEPAPEAAAEPAPAPVAEVVPEPVRREAAKAEAMPAPAFITPTAAKAPVEAKPAPEPEPEPKPAARKAAKPRTGSALDAALAKSREPATRAGPELLTAPRGGKPDDLKMIKGVGPKLEKLLNDVGVWHFDQIASWKAKDIAIVDERLVGFKGRISRDGWVKQAKVLAKGGSTEFSKRVAKGGVY